MRLFILAFFISLTSYAATNKDYTQYTRNFRGLHVNAILGQWGTPDVRSTSPNGNQVWIYRTQTRMNHPSVSPQIGVAHTASRPVMITQPPGQVGARENVVISCVTTIEINRNGYVTNIQASGSKCPRLPR